ncbi:MAG TPA: GspH/FimT family pseudopilin [Pseudomonas sp.]|nr:GspH/FimT family pseudopilin [Pseudomonas sp.]
MRSSRGFTLIELMIAVSLLAVVAALAAPAMGDFIVRQRVASQAGDLALAMALARSEAIKGTISVSVIPRTQSPSGWGSGWCVAPASAADCDDARVLRQFPSRSNVTITSADLASPFTVTFLRDGTRGFSSGRPHFKVSSAQLPTGGQNARCVLLTPQGRTEVMAVALNTNCPQ